MPRRLPVRALALALALAAAAAAGVDAAGFSGASGSISEPKPKLPDCRVFAHVARSNDPGAFPACSLLENGKLLRVNFAPGELPTTGETYAYIRMFDLGRVDRADVPKGLIDLIFGTAGGKTVLEREIDEAYGFKSFSKRWKRMRKQGSKEGLPALIVDYSDVSLFETKLNKVKFGEKNGVVFADYKVSKGSRAALASAWGSDIDEAFARSYCVIYYATPCPRLGLP